MGFFHLDGLNRVDDRSIFHPRQSRAYSYRRFRDRRIEVTLGGIVIRPREGENVLVRWCFVSDGDYTASLYGDLPPSNAAVERQIHLA